MSLSETLPMRAGFRLLATFRRLCRSAGETFATISVPGSSRAGTFLRFLCAASTTPKNRQSSWWLRWSAPGNQERSTSCRRRLKSSFPAVNSFSCNPFELSAPKSTCARAVTIRLQGKLRSDCIGFRTRGFIDPPCAEHRSDRTDFSGAPQPYQPTTLPVAAYQAPAFAGVGEAFRQVQGADNDQDNGREASSQNPLAGRSLKSQIRRKDVGSPLTELDWPWLYQGSLASCVRKIN